MYRHDDDNINIDKETPLVSRKGAPLRILLLVGVSLQLFACGGISIAAFFVARKGLSPTYAEVNIDEFVDEWEVNPTAAIDKYSVNGVEFTINFRILAQILVIKHISMCVAILIGRELTSLAESQVGK